MDARRVLDAVGNDVQDRLATGDDPVTAPPVQLAQR